MKSRYIAIFTSYVSDILAFDDIIMLALSSCAGKCGQDTRRRSEHTRTIWPLLPSCWLAAERLYVKKSLNHSPTGKIYGNLF